jgi:hypothetical protein
MTKFTLKIDKCRIFEYRKFKFHFLYPPVYRFFIRMYDMWQIKDQWLGFNKSENQFFFCLIKNQREARYREMQK